MRVCGPSVTPERAPSGCLWTILLAVAAWCVIAAAAVWMFEAVGR